MRVRAAVGAAVLGMALMSGQAQAQSSAVISVSATVLGGITLAVPTNLAFGTVQQTGGRSIAVTEAGAGRMTISAAAAQPVTVSFVLPTTMTGPTAGAAVLSSWVGRSTLAVGGSATANTPQDFNPAAGAYTRTLSPTGEMSIFLGGTLTTTAAAAGSYAADVNVSVTY